MIHVHFRRRVPATLRRLLRHFAAEAGRQMDIRHEVLVYVSPCVALCTPDPHDADRVVACGFGVFSVYGDPLIGLAAGVARLPGCGPLAVVECFAHELIHYEQWRDTHATSHRRMNRRAHRLMVEILAVIRPRIEFGRKNVLARVHTVRGVPELALCNR